VLTKINIVTRVKGKGDVATEGYLADEVNKQFELLKLDIKRMLIVLDALTPEECEGRIVLNEWKKKYSEGN
jgi:hypothetical protein